MHTATLSILIPLYNEEEFIVELLNRVLAAPLPEGLDREIIIVDDCSTDDSLQLAEAFVADHPETRMRLYRQTPNQGKGAAIRKAIDAATGEFGIVQDADLEYNPAEIGKLMGPLLRGDADAVFGSRFLVAGETRVLYFWHSVANRMADAALQYRIRSQSDGYGNLLQGLPNAACEKHSPHQRTLRHGAGTHH